MNKKALIAAGVAAALGLALLYLYMRRFEEEATGGAPVMVLMATTDIPLGAVLTQQMIGTRALPAMYVEERHIRASDAQRVLGVRVSMGVKANESLLWSDLATTTEQRRDLSAIVQQGYRAITVRAGLTSSFGGLLRPGDRVDVLFTADRPGTAGSSPGEVSTSRVTIPLLQNLVVLAVGRDTGAEARPGSPQQRAGGGQSFNQVTLSVTVQQAQMLTFAEDRGELTLILRNPDDIAVLQGLPETTASDILEPARRAAIQRRDVPRPAADTGPTIERVQ
jgi:pilus assembly protein CpaB